MGVKNLNKKEVYINNINITDSKNDIKIKSKNIRYKEDYYFTVITFGCKVNQSESDEIISELNCYGLTHTGDITKSDIVIINTCTVTAQTDSKIRQFIRKVKRLNPKSKVFVTGCFVKFNEDFLKNLNIKNYYQNEEKNKIPKIVLRELKLDDGSKFIEKDSFYVKNCSVEHDSKSYKSNGNVNDIKNDNKNPKLLGKHTRHFIKIQDGCEQNCTYCIIPLVRGKYTSKMPDDIVNEIKFVQSIGLEEVVLTGIHLGNYGVDLNLNNSNEFNLAKLLNTIIKTTNIKRIRLSSIEINEISPELIEIIKKNKNVASHLHIPLQSGSNKILQLMKRPYDIEFFSSKINQIKKEIPDISITTDVMVGFPNEDEEDFNDTIKVVKEIKFSKVHVFKFSKREGTVAFSMNGQISEEIKQQRGEILRKICDGLRKTYLESFIGMTLSVLIEKINFIDMIVTGMAENYIKVYAILRGDESYVNTCIKIGKISDVKITGFFKDGLLGEILF
jgi:threonylcarbamoyladenosine tRNA methylthiotransferase MtaB